MTWTDGDQVVPAGTPGAFLIHGRLRDGTGEPVPDGVVETWQADSEGGFAHAAPPFGSGSPSFGGLGRSLTGPDGHYSIRTVKPGRVSDGAGGLQAPHLDVSILARGLLHRLVMRIYFGDEHEANAADPVLSALPDDAARSTLVAEPDGDGGYALDVRLQGDDETVFFAV